MAQKERENFYRNSTVIVDHGKDSLAAVLENDLANTNLTFEDFINRHQHNIYHLCYNRCPCCQCPTGRFVPANQSRILYPDQLDVLLDKYGPTLHGHTPNIARPSQHCCRQAKPSLSYTNLDITLLRCLLINFAQNCRTNSTLKQDIEALVKCRNKLYGHVQEARVTETDYTKNKTEVESIILRIARFCNIENEMQQKLTDASKRPLDETILMQYQNTLLQQSFYDRNIDEKVNKLEQHLNSQDETLDRRMGILEGKIGEVDHGKRNIISQTEACLYEHSKDNTYVITENVQLCCDILDKYKTLIIIAKAGGGKSKTSLQIAMMYQEKMYTPMLFLNDEVVRKREVINFNEQNIIIAEDLLGRSTINFNEDLHKGIFDVLHSCFQSESCKSKLIITIRGNDKIKQKLVENHKMFQKDVFINLDEALSVHCKMNILSEHMNKHGISLCDCQNRLQLPRIQCSREVFETSVNTMKVCMTFFNAVCRGQYAIQIGFPQACHLFCSNKNFTKQGKTYFMHTSQGLVDEMNCLKIDGFDNKRIQYQYCALVYAAIKNAIDLDDIDELHFLNILSSIYQKDDKIKTSLLKDAVLVLEGTYICKNFIKSTTEEIKRPKVSEKYFLQHNTILEAVLISYGIDADISPFCDLRFLEAYIRPKGFTDEFSESMVLLFIEYKPLVKILISMLSIDNKTCTGVGRYLKIIALLHRRDEIIQFFFQNVKDGKPEQYTYLLNGLTNDGKNSALVKLHPQLCTEVMMHAGLNVFLAFCKPIGWVDNGTSFVAMETDLLIKTLFKFFGKLDKNGEGTKDNIIEYFRRITFSKRGLGNHLYAVGDYVFKYLIVKNCVNIVELFFKKLKQNILQINPIDMKDFLDGLLDEGKRSSTISQYIDFFEEILFKYGSIPVITELCRPLSSTITSQNVIKIDDKLLAGKLAAYLEWFSENNWGLQTSTIAALRENGKYFVFWDYDFFEKDFIDKIALYISKHGFTSNNEKFVQVMYEQFISYKKEQSNDTQNVDYYVINSTDDATNKEDADENYAVNGKKVVFNDFPGEELRVDAKGMVIQSIVKIFSVKEIYRDPLDESIFRSTYSRLYHFVSDLTSMFHWSTPGTLIGLFRIKFECLFDDIDPGIISSDSDSSDHFDSFDSGMDY